MKLKIDKKMIDETVAILDAIKEMTTVLKKRLASEIDKNNTSKKKENQ